MKIRRDPYGDPMWLQHNKIRLALHVVQEGEGSPLLLLHGLGGETPTVVPADAANWPGPVVGLDFTGHGRSTVPVGGGYSPEVLMGDADAALARLGPSTLLGTGLGAYIALLIAGARPELVRGAVLADGPGLTGGASGPSSASMVEPLPGTAPPDPYALVELSRDVRPPDYAASFMRQAIELGPVDPALTISTVWLPDWMKPLADEPGVARTTVTDALAHYAMLP